MGNFSNQAKTHSCLPLVLELVLLDLRPSDGISFSGSCPSKSEVSTVLLSHVHLPAGRKVQCKLKNSLHDAFDINLALFDINAFPLRWAWVHMLSVEMEAE